MNRNKVSGTLQLNKIYSFVNFFVSKTHKNQLRSQQQSVDLYHFEISLLIRSLSLLFLRARARGGEGRGERSEEV